VITFARRTRPARPELATAMDDLREQEPLAGSARCGVIGGYGERSLLGPLSCGPVPTDAVAADYDAPVTVTGGDA
jgi:hypothetical protein